jgi:hypothetical protein
MEIQQEEHGKKGAFYIEEHGEWIAELTYVKSGDSEITICRARSPTVMYSPETLAAVSSLRAKFAPSVESVGL